MTKKSRSVSATSLSLSLMSYIDLRVRITKTRGQWVTRSGMGGMVGWEHETTRPSSHVLPADGSNELRSVEPSIALHDILMSMNCCR